MPASRKKNKVLFFSLQFNIDQLYVVFTIIKPLANILNGSEKNKNLFVFLSYHDPPAIRHKMSAIASKQNIKLCFLKKILSFGLSYFVRSIIKNNNFKK